MGRGQLSELFYWLILAVDIHVIGEGAQLIAGEQRRQLIGRRRKLADWSRHSLAVAQTEAGAHLLGLDSVGHLVCKTLKIFKNTIQNHNNTMIQNTFKNTIIQNTSK